MHSMMHVAYLTTRRHIALGRGISLSKMRETDATYVTSRPSHNMILPSRPNESIRLRHGVSFQAARVLAVFAEAVVSPNAYKFWSCVVVLYHTVNALFIVALGSIHIYLSQPTVYANVWLIRISPEVLAASGWSLLMIAVIHIVAVMLFICRSFSKKEVPLGISDTETPPSPFAIITKPSRISRLTTTALLPVVILQRVFGERGLFGVRGSHFYVGFYLRQAIESVLQTYQAYQLSVSSPRMWINRFVASLVILNCAFVPIINHVLGAYPGPRRTMLLTCDLILDFVAMVGVPIVVLIPYVLEFNFSAGRYDAIYTHDDIWITTIVSEVRQLLVSSTMDFVSTIFPHLTGLLTLETIKELLQGAQEKHARQKHLVGHAHKNQVVPATTIHALAPQPQTTPRNQAKPLKKSAKAYYTFALVWAVFVASMSAYANHDISSVAPDDNCHLRLNPWFATNATCAVVQINCHRQRILGGSEELAHVLAKMARPTLARLIISHCPSVSIPPIVTEFYNLLHLQLFNSTLTSWPHEAAITRLKTPYVNQVHFIATNFTDFPVGLLHDQLPVKLSLLIHKSNLTEIPDQFTDLWRSHTWPYFRIEHTQVALLPPTIPQIRTKRLSLVGNQLATLPEDLFVIKGLKQILLSSNNLTTVPSMSGNGSAGLYHFMAENTSIGSLPPWFEMWWAARLRNGQRVVVSFKGSPLCDNSTYTHTEACAGVDVEISGAYRYDMVAQHRAQE